MWLMMWQPLSGQESMVEDTSKNILLLHERAFGGMVHTQGWGIRYGQGYHVTAFKRRAWLVEMTEMQSLRQTRTINPYFTNSKSYIYGKLNALYNFRFNYGYYKQLNRKPYWGGVEVRWFYSGGLSLILAKPIYLFILEPTAGLNEYTIVEEKYDPDKHFWDNIYGRAPFTRGLNEIKPYPGIHIKTGLEFEYASYRNKTKTLEAGGALDLFPIPVPLMAKNDPHYYFATLYVAFTFGSRYNK